MTKIIDYQNYIFIFFLSIFSFFINFYVGNVGVFPVDTFIHYDNGYRILLGEHPVKDYWIVHGYIIDYIQALFFKVFGNEWNSYLYHSSIFNTCITLFSFYIFRLLNLDTKISLLLSILLSILAYPVSGTPFLDLHSSYFSLFAIYFGIISIKKDNSLYWFWSSFFLCLAFFSKQVPAGYTIVFISLFILYLTIIEKKPLIFLYFISGALFFLLLLFIFLVINEISITDFILQIFQFPLSIGSNRYENYSLSFKNLILDYKFIYIIFIISIALNVREFFSDKKLNKDNLNIFLLFSIFVLTSIFHQVYTKNQSYIFFLIPICSGIAIFYNNLKSNNLRKYLNFFIIFLCIFSTLKYHERFNVKRKFHELQYTDLAHSSSLKKLNKKFNNLKWISPYFQNPEEEISYISNFLDILKKENEKVMVITQYNFFSLLTEKKLYSPSRTYDLISYPRKNSKYYNSYKKFLINMFKENEIKKVYIFENYINLNLNHLLFDYIKSECFDNNKLNKNLLLLEVKNCETLN